MKEDKNILNKPIVTWGLAALIVFSVVSYSLDTLPSLDPTLRQFLYFSEIIIVLIFTVEYLYRIAITENKMKFIFSFYGLVDLLAILPFYLATAIDLRSVRLFRLLRLARVLKLVRYNHAIARFGKALVLCKEELVVFTFATAILLFLAAVGIYHFEHKAQPEVFRSIFDCLWWAVTSLTTVGYGDMYPITAGGRIFTIILLMLGLGMVAVPTGILSSALLEIRVKNAEEENE